MDDFSPRPIAPTLDIFEEQEQQDEKLLAQDQRKAKAYFHPAWDGVEELFMQRIETLRIGTTDTSLDPMKYAVEDQANKKAAAIVMDIWGQVKNAIIATEGNRKGGK